MKTFRHYKSVSTLALARDLCIGCRLCTYVCPHQVFGMNGQTVEIIDFDACMECGACVVNCPSGALSVNPGVG